MAKSLKKVLKDNPSIDFLKNKGEKAFAAKHKVEVVADANGNDDEVFKGRDVSPRPRGSVAPDSPKDSYGAAGPMKAGILTKELGEGAGIISAKGSANPKVKVGKGATAKVVNSNSGQQPGKTDKYVKEAVTITKRSKSGFSGVFTGSPSDKKFLERWGVGKSHPTGVKHAKANPMVLKPKTKKAVNESLDEVSANLASRYLRRAEKDLKHGKKTKNRSEGIGQAYQRVFKESIINEQEYFKLSIPLLIRLMEYAREDAKTDMDLHFVAERVVEFGEKDLCMDDYKKLVKEETVDEGLLSGIKKIGKKIGAKVNKALDPQGHQASVDNNRRHPENNWSAAEVRRRNLADETKSDETKLIESVTRKHFRDVANTVRAIEDPVERQKFADHHAAIFAGMNPRFDHARFHAAAGTQYTAPKGRKAVKEEAIDENVLKTIKNVAKKAKKVVKDVAKFEVDNWKRTDS